MIRPTHPCRPGCPGWRVVRVLASHLVQPCRACWARDVLKPTPSYYHRQQECLDALRKVTPNDYVHVYDIRL